MPSKEEKLDAPDLVTWCPGCPERMRRLVESCSYTHQLVLFSFPSTRATREYCYKVVDKTAGF